MGPSAWARASNEQITDFQDQYLSTLSRRHEQVDRRRQMAARSAKISGRRGRATPEPRPVRPATTLAISVLMALAAAGTCGARDLAAHHQMTFMPTQASAPLMAAAAPPGLPEASKCKIGAPLQWRPHLDASSKAYLAPVVALASLEHFTLAPIQLAATGGGAGPGSRASKQAPAADLRLAPQASLAQHAQSVNNVGVLIEATFQVRKVIRRPARGADLRPGRLVSLHYKVSASLATTSDMIALAGSMEASPNQSRPLAPGPARAQAGGECPLELTERELSRKGGDLFKVGRDYVLFVESASVVRRLYAAAPRGPAQQHQHQQVVVDQWWHAFAAHEPASNQTSRSVNRVLCKNCVRPPTVRLVNSTFVAGGPAAQERRRIKLDCRVSGFPAPWVEWFRNGKPLRNRPGRSRIRTSSWRGRPNERLSRLELELVAGRNETGVYECRAMNVAAREPAVGAYTLLVLPGQLVLLPMQAARGKADQPERGRDQKSATRANNKTGEQAPALQPQAAPAEAHTTTTSADSAPTPAPPSSQQQAAGGGRDTAAAAVVPSAPADDAPGQSGPQQPPPPPPQPRGGGASKASPVVVGQPCPGEAHDKFCLNRGTCVHIGHIEEYFCNCSEGYHGHRCEYKSLGHQQNSH